MAKTLQYCKVISLQLIKINGKKVNKKKKKENIAGTIESSFTLLVILPLNF